MKKRIIALLCAITLFIPSVTVGAASFTDIPEDTAEDRMLTVLKDLGVMVGYEDGSFGGDKPITRAEFVTMIYNTVSIWNSVGGEGGSDALDEFFRDFFLNGGANGMELLIPGQGEEEETVNLSYWTDVSVDYWAYPYMKAASTYGLVKGYPDGTFKPDNTITYYEAVTVLLNLCGYSEHAKARGGFPDGYNSLATYYQLHKGLYATGYNELSRMDAARLIYNSFNIKLATVTGIEDDTYLSDVIGVYIEEGTLTDTDVTSIYHTEAMKEYEARINDITFTFGKEDIEIRDYIGQDLRVYLKETGENTGKYELKSYEVIGKEKKTVIDAELFEDYMDNTFYYKTDKDNKKVKKVEVRNGSVLIYNGKYAENYSKDIFENINKGTITVIEKDSLDFDIIVVEDYRTGYTDSKNMTDLEIYDNIAEGVGNSIISLKSTDVNVPMLYELRDRDGNEIKLENISTGAVNYYRNDNYAKVYFSDKVVKGLLRKQTEDDGIYYEVGGERYRISDTYLNYSGGDVRTNIQGTITVDKYDEVVWMTDDVDMTGYSYIFKTRYNAEENQILITYFDINEGAVKEKVPVVSEKFKFYGVDGQAKAFSNEILVEELAAYDGIAKIMLNDDGEIKAIRLALANAEEASDKLMLVKEGSYWYTNGGSGFGGRYYLNTDSKVLQVPLDKTNYDNFKMYNNTSNFGATLPCKLYSFDPESPYARIVLAYQQSSASSGINVATDTKYYLVTKIVDTINADGELVKEATLYDGSNYTTVVAKEDDTGVTAFDNAFSADANSQNAGYKVEKGDFIFYTTDTATGEVDAVRLIFDANAVNPAWCGCDPADKATTCNQNHTHTDNLGHFPGTTGFYAKNAYSNTNPVGYLNTGLSGYTKEPGSANNRQFYVFGYFNQLKEGMYEWTTQNIRENWNGEKDTENYQWAYDTIATSIKVYIVDDEMNVEAGTLQSIKTYKQAGAKCSKVLLRYVGGRINAVWILPN